MNGRVNATRGNKHQGKRQYVCSRARPLLSSSRASNCRRGSASSFWCLRRAIRNLDCSSPRIPSRCRAPASSSASAGSPGTACSSPSGSSRLRSRRGSCTRWARRRSPSSRTEDRRLLPFRPNKEKK